MPPGGSQPPGLHTRNWRFLACVCNLLRPLKSGKAIRVLLRPETFPQRPIMFLMFGSGAVIPLETVKDAVLPLASSPRTSRGHLTTAESSHQRPAEQVELRSGQRSVAWAAAPGEAQN